MTPNINTILAKNPRPCSRGAPFGDSSFFNTTSKLYLQRVEFVDRDYAKDGTYWGGGGKPLWCAFNGDDSEYAAAMGTRVYVRAWDRDAAKKEVLSQYPEAKFVR